MYTQHFGLTQDPFSIAPDPRFLFMSERHREALAHLLFGVAGKDNTAGGTGGGFVLLTGDIGTGKTTICRCFLEQIPAHCHVAYIFNPKLSVLELLQSICEEFHISAALGNTQTPTAKTYIDALNTFLLQSHAEGQSCVLIIDEAQNLSSDVLEQLRLLTNLETNARKLLQIVLIGQPELRTLLAAPELEQLAQRVIARFHLDALNATETTHYITHRLGVAGHTGTLPFNPKALARVHQLAHGVPRRINLLCGRALLGAWATGRQRVDPAVVNKAASEVFGLDDARASSFWPAQRTAAMLGGLVLVAAAAGVGFMLWPHAAPPLTLAPTLVKAAPTATPPQQTAKAALPATQPPQVTGVTPLQQPAQVEAAPLPNAATSTAATSVAAQNTTAPNTATSGIATVAPNTATSGTAAPNTAAPGTAAPTTPVSDLDLKARVQAFQQAQGLKPDGVLGPLTFIQMERALGLTPPGAPSAPVQKSP